MKYFFTVFICKIFIAILKLMGKKATSAPGKLAFKLYPDILKEYQGRVKKEIIAVMGTNGKTTTNNLLADFFEESGYNVVCNRIGANMDEGSLVAFLNKTSLFGRTNIDYACLEMDEGWAEYILNFITPSKIIVTNLFADQLDRYGSMESIMEFLKKAIRKAPDATLILNADDPISCAMAKEFENKKVYFGIKDKLSDTETPLNEGKNCFMCGLPLDFEFRHFSHLGKYKCVCGFERPENEFNAKDISLFPVVDFEIENYGRLTLNSRGLYNVYNTLAAFTAATKCGVEFDAVNKAIEKYKPQTGRMEKLSIKGKECYLILAKNPAGFNLSISAVAEDIRTKDIYLAVNNRISDGVDVSWLKDVDFSPIINENTLSFTTAGTKAEDALSRLKEQNAVNFISYDDMKTAIENVLSNSKGDVIYFLANYTALYETKDVLDNI